MENLHIADIMNVDFVFSNNNDPLKNKKNNNKKQSVSTPRIPFTSNSKFFLKPFSIKTNTQNCGNKIQFADGNSIFCVVHEKLSAGEGWFVSISNQSNQTGAI